MSWIKITAKYKCRCDICLKTLNADEDCMMEISDRVYAHVDCYENELSKMSNAQSPIKPVQDGVTARYNPPPKKD